MCSHMEYCALTRAILNILRIFSSPAVVICDTEDGIDVALAPSKRMNIQGGDGGWLLGWVNFDLGMMFHHPAWAVGSYSSGLQAGGTPQI